MHDGRRWILPEHVGRGDATRIKIDDIGVDKTPGATKGTATPYAAVSTGDSEVAVSGDVELVAAEEALVNRSVKTLTDISFEIKKGA